MSNTTESTVTPEYVAMYLSADSIYDGIRNNNRATNCQIIRDGLVALALAPGTVKDKQIATGILWSKVSRDVITGLWLAAHPEEDAIDAKACGNKLSKKQMADCETVAALRKLMPKAAPKAPKAPKVPKVKDETGPPIDTDVTPEDTAPVSKVITTPEEHATAITALALAMANFYHLGQVPTDEAHHAMNSALNALAREMRSQSKAIAAA